MRRALESSLKYLKQIRITLLTFKDCKLYITSLKILVENDYMQAKCCSSKLGPALSRIITRAGKDVP